jgi:hypothetical protein
MLPTSVYGAYAISGYVEYLEVWHISEVLPLEMRPVRTNYPQILNSETVQTSKNFTDVVPFARRKYKM